MTGRCSESREGSAYPPAAVASRSTLQADRGMASSSSSYTCSGSLWASVAETPNLPCQGAPTARAVPGFELRTTQALRRISRPRPCQQEGHHDSAEVADRGGEAGDREDYASGENDVPPAAPGAGEPDGEARPENNGEHHDPCSLVQRRACSADSEAVGGHSRTLAHGAVVYGA
jgi:hypothetical protein